MTECAADFRLLAYNVEIEEDTMHRVLDDGGKLVCSVSPGDFTSTGHFIVINGGSGKGFTVLDPNNVELSKKIWSFSVLAPQIAGIWAYYPA